MSFATVNSQSLSPSYSSGIDSSSFEEESDPSKTSHRVAKFSNNILQPPAHPNYFVKAFVTKLMNRYAQILESNKSGKFSYNLIQNINQISDQFFIYLKYFKINKNNLSFGVNNYLSTNELNRLHQFFASIPHIENINYHYKKASNYFNFSVVKSYVAAFISIYESLMIQYSLNKAANDLNVYQDLKQEYDKSFSNHQISDELNRYLNELKEDIAKHAAFFKEENLYDKKIDINLLKVFVHMGGSWITHHSKTISNEILKKISKCIIHVYKDIRSFYIAYKNFNLANEWQTRLKPNFIISSHFSSLNDLKIEEKASRFLKELQDSTQISDVNQKLEQIGLHVLNKDFSDIEICHQLLKNKAVCQEIKNAYLSTYHKSFNCEKLNERIARQKTVFDDQVTNSLLWVEEQINQQAEQNWDTIKSHFKRFHVDIDQIQFEKGNLNLNNYLGSLRIFVNSKESWSLAIQQSEFRKQLAIQRVNHQHAVAQLVEQTMRHAISSKIDVEKTLISYRFYERFVVFTTCGAKLAVSFLFPQWIGVKEFLEIITHNGIVPGLGLMAIFYPNTILSVENLLIKIINHFLSCRKKPNEYSLEGYKISFHQQAIDFFMFMYHFTSTIQKLALWLYLKVAHVILRQSGHDHEQRRKNLEDKINQKKADYLAQMTILNNRLTDLYLKDVQFNLYSRSDHPSIDTNALPPLLDIIKEALEEADFNCFPEHVYQFFKENLGVKLQNENMDDIVKTIEDFFKLNEEKFFQSYYLQQTNKIYA